MPQLDPLTEQQLMGICSLQQSSQQAEEALSQGLEQLQQSLANTLATGSLNDGANAGNYMVYMTMALGKLSNLEGFVRQVLSLFYPSSHHKKKNKKYLFSSIYQSITYNSGNDESELMVG